MIRSTLSCIHLLLTCLSCIEASEIATNFHESADGTKTTEVFKISDFVNSPHFVHSEDSRRRLENPSDYFYADHPDVTNAFWVFAPDGVKIYSPDGSELIKHLHNTEICLEADSCRRGVCTTYDTCSFYTAATDGEKYVFATNSRAGGFVEIFSLQGGLHLGSMPTCNFPYFLDYSPHREEVWVHCWSPGDEYGDTGHVDTFSKNAFGLDHTQINVMNETLQSHGHGMVTMDAATPNFAWGTQLDQSALFKIDVWTREAEMLDLTESGCVGFYRMAISQKNRHAYMRCYVCCSCGIDKDTQEECGSYARNVTLPLQDNIVVPGNCGHTCDKSLADTVGTLEYDLENHKLLGNHYFSDIGNGNLHGSPSGEYMIIMGDKGGMVKILQAGENGELSTDNGAGDVITGFGDDGATNDFEFVESELYSSAIITSTRDNYVVIADLDAIAAGSPSVPTHALNLVSDMSRDTTSGHGRGARRQVAWATGTQYAMVTGMGADEIYFVDLGTSGDISDARVSRTLTGAPSKIIQYVPAVSSTQDNFGQDGRDGQDGQKGDYGYDGSDGSDGQDASNKEAKLATVLATVAVVLACGAFLGIVVIAVIVVKHSSLLEDKRLRERSDSEIQFTQHNGKLTDLPTGSAL